MSVETYPKEPVTIRRNLTHPAVFAALLVLIALATLLAPAEQILGGSARIVYLHGALVWAAILAFWASGAAGLAALLTRRRGLTGWSTALARSGLALWLVQQPMSLLVMQLNWGGLFLDEPRWRISMTFAVTGLLLQAALALFDRPWVSAVANLGYAVALALALRGMTSVMHPDSPILNSSAHTIQLFFGLLMGLNLLAAAWMAVAWRRSIRE